MQPNLVRTVCRDCIFAKYEDNTQTACSIGQLEKLVAAGGKLIEAYDAQNKEFFIIDDVLCMFRREQAWAVGKSQADWVKHIREEMTIQYQVIVIASPGTSFDKISKTIRSAAAQTLKPRKITVIRLDTCEIPKSHLMSMLKDYDVPWELRCNADDDNLIIDEAVTNSQGTQYYGVFGPGFQIPENWFSYLDKKVIDQNFEFAVISDDDVYIASRFIHEYLNGNVGKSLTEKLRENQCQKMIKTPQSVFKDCPK